MWVHDSARLRRVQGGRGGERLAGLCRGACSPPPGDTGPGCVARLSNIASSLGRPVYTGLKKIKGLAPHPWAVLSPLASHSNGCACVCGGGVFGTILHYLNMLGDLRTTHEAYNRGRWTAPRVSSLVSLNILSMGGTPRAYKQHTHTHTHIPASIAAFVMICD